MKTNKSKAKPGSDPATDVLLSYADYAQRYRIHIEVVKRKIRESGIPILRPDRKLGGSLERRLAIEEAGLAICRRTFRVDSRPNRRHQHERASTRGSGLSRIKKEAAPMKEIVCSRDSHNRGRIEGLATGDRVSINSGAWEEKGSR